MKVRLMALALAFTMLLAAVNPVLMAGEPWRSALYPADWEPCFQDRQGRFLQDYSFAGYHAGNRPLPTETPHPIVDVTKAPYFADPSGRSDATAAIQQAIDDVGKSGGGTVYLPPGTYSLTIADGAGYALQIAHSNVHLRGAGVDQTFLRLDTHYARATSMIQVFGTGTWTNEISGSSQLIAADLTYPTQVIPLDGPPRFDVGDWVVLSHDVTADWIADHNMSDLWEPGTIPGATFYRQVIDVDEVNNAIVIDIPIRYYLLQRDGARVYRVRPHIEEVSLSDFSLGMIEHPGTVWGSEDYTVKGTPAYDVHSSYAIRFRHVVNGWIRNVHTYQPEGNEWAHILSNGIHLTHSRNITVTGTDFRNPQYQGAGGNGYHYILVGNDNLLIDTAAYNGRHNYDFKQAYASGNVITRSYSYSPDGLASDFHMHLSPSNLIDDFTLDQDRWDARWRSTSGTIPHGLSTTQSVFWNTTGLAYMPGSGGAIIWTEQYGWGYVIGTQGPASNVRTQPFTLNDRLLVVDYIEGVGESAGLEPSSLYADQLRRRQDRGGMIHCPNLDFRPKIAQLEIVSPEPHARLQGDVELQFAVQTPEGVPVESFSIEIGTETLYSGPTVPNTYTLDTLALRDGGHTLTATVTLLNGVSTQVLLPVQVRNWWTLRDPFEGPTQTGWFGVLDRSRTSSRSDGWIYEMDDLRFEDPNRIRRATPGEEYLEWEIEAQLVEFVLSAYAQVADVRDTVSVAVSTDRQAWTELDYEQTVLETAGEWVHLELHGHPESHAVPKWFRVTLLASDLPADALELGQLELRSRR